MLTEEELLERKSRLIEHLGVHLEKVEQLSPVASRIYAAVMLSCKQGITFEQLTQDMGASKSTISTNLNMLESNGQIEYFTKPGDRKRYYIPASDRFIRFIDEKIERCKLESKIQQGIINYKKAVNEVRKNDHKNQCDLQHNKDILTFLEESIASFKRLKVTLSEE